MAENHLIFSHYFCIACTKEAPEIARPVLDKINFNWNPLVNDTRFKSKHTLILGETDFFGGTSAIFGVNFVFVLIVYIIYILYLYGVKNKDYGNSTEYQT